MLARLKRINGEKFIVSNDTGPAHIASHLKKNGLVLFGSHTTAKKVSIENKSFKAISVENLSNLNVDRVSELKQCGKYLLYIKFFKYSERLKNQEQP